MWKIFNKIGIKVCNYNYIYGININGWFKMLKEQLKVHSKYSQRKLCIYPQSVGI